MTCFAVAVALALLPFAALFAAASARRERVLALWEAREERGAAETFRVRAALDPGVRHTIWIWTPDREVGRTFVPPLRDEDGRHVELAPGDYLFHPEPHEMEVTKREEQGNVFDGRMILEQVARIAGDAELFVDARLVHRGTVLALAPADGRYHFKTSPSMVSKGPAEPRPAASLHLPALVAVALATTMPLFLLAYAIESPGPALLSGLVVFGVCARAYEIDSRIAHWLSREEMNAY